MSRGGLITHERFAKPFVQARLARDPARREHRVQNGDGELGLSCRKDGSPDLLLPLIATGILLTPVRTELRIAVENHIKREHALGSENAGKR
jgi:hypothetical protein